MTWLVIAKVILSLVAWIVPPLCVAEFIRACRSDDLAWAAVIGVIAMLLAAGAALLMHVLWGA